MSAVFDIPIVGAAASRPPRARPVAAEPGADGRAVGPDVRAVAASDLPALRRLIRDEATEWDGCLRRLVKGAAWLLDHDRLHPRWMEAQQLSRELNSRMFRARLNGGHALLKYVGAYSTLNAEALAAERAHWTVDPSDARALWASAFPCPVATGRVAEGLNPSMWWDESLGELPEGRDAAPRSHVWLLTMNGPDDRFRCGDCREYIASRSPLDGRCRLSLRGNSPSVGYRWQADWQACGAWLTKAIADAPETAAPGAQLTLGGLER